MALGKQIQIDRLRSEIAELKNKLDAQKHTSEKIMDLLIQAGVLEFHVYGINGGQPFGEYRAISKSVINSTPSTKAVSKIKGKK